MWLMLLLAFVGTMLTLAAIWPGFFLYFVWFVYIGIVIFGIFAFLDIKNTSKS